MSSVFQKRLRMLREAAGLSQAALGLKLGATNARIAQVMISRWETSEKHMPSITAITKIAEVLGCTTDDLLCDPSVIDPSNIPNRKWIPVARQMPVPEDDVILVFFDYGEGGSLFSFVGFAKHDGTWCYASGLPITGTVLAWMPTERSERNIDVHYIPKGVDMPRMPLVRWPHNY